MNIHRMYTMNEREHLVLSGLLHTPHYLRRYNSFSVWENFYNVKQHDYFYDLFNFSFANIVKPVKYISSGLLFLIVMLFMIVSLKRKGLKSVVGFAPIIGLWITIMIATPTAFSLRYVYILVLIIPISFLLPEILEDTV